MRLLKRSLPALTATALLSTCSGAALADSIYDFTYSGQYLTISGTLSASDTETNGGYLIDGINATAYYTYGYFSATYSITTLLAVDTVGGSNDNLLLITAPGDVGPGPYVHDGFAFLIADSSMKIYCLGDPGNYYESNRTDSGGAGFADDDGTFTLTAPAVVPEPSSLVLMATAGLMGLGHVVRRRWVAGAA